MQLWAPPRVPIQIQCANCNCSNVITFVETDGEKERSTLTQVQLNLGLSWPYLAATAAALNRLAKPFIVCHQHHQHRISGRILKIIQHNHNSRGGFEYCVKAAKLVVVVIRRFADCPSIPRTISLQSMYSTSICTSCCTTRGVWWMVANDVQD